MFSHPTISRYFAKRFFRTTLIIFLVVFVLIAVIDYLELARRSTSGSNTALLYLMVSLTRVPSVVERAMPFTILFASIASFVMANRQLELVIARASGLSAWQFIGPAGIVAILIGIGATTAFNPMSTALKQFSSDIAGRIDTEEAKQESIPEKKPDTVVPPGSVSTSKPGDGKSDLLASASGKSDLTKVDNSKPDVGQDASKASGKATGKTGSKKKTKQGDGSDWDVWLRQTGTGGSSIIGAKSSAHSGLSLLGVSGFLFASDGSLAKRIDAPTADYQDGEWVFHNALVMAPGSRPETVDEAKIATDLRADQVRQRLADPDTVSFWALPELIEISKNAGVQAYPYQMQYQALLSQPLLFLAMVLVAATVSLRFSRSRDLGRMILTGVIVGFMLYVVTELARGLGRSGVVPPMIAAWTPAIVATLMSVTVLLHREDG